jgi:uncharacterized membrane protein
MSGLIAAFALFIALHSIPAIPALRNRIIATIGRRTYLTLYSVVSTLVLVWLFWEALRTDYIELWEPAAWQAWVTIVAAPSGIFLVVAGLLSRNPFSVSVRQGDSDRGAIVEITRHPVLWGFLLWSAGHVVPNGDLRSLILFGGFAAFSLAGIVMLERRARRRLGEIWHRLAASTSILPFAAVLGGRTRLRFDGAIAISLAVTALLVVWLLTGGHALLFGVDPLALATAF